MTENSGVNICVCCGAPIPEGRHVCVNCEDELIRPTRETEKMMEERLLCR